MVDVVAGRANGPGRRGIGIDAVQHAAPAPKTNEVDGQLFGGASQSFPQAASESIHDCPAVPPTVPVPAI